MLHWRGCVLIYAVLALEQGQARVLFHSNNQSIYCSATTRFLGPQHGPDHSPAVTASLVVLRSDPCSVQDAAEVRGKAVFLATVGTCLDEIIYEQFQEAGALVVFRASRFWPGLSANLQFTSRRRSPDWNNLIYMKVFSPDLPPDWVRPGTASRSRWTPTSGSRCSNRACISSVHDGFRPSST